MLCFHKMFQFVFLQQIVVVDVAAGGDAAASCEWLLERAAFNLIWPAQLGNAAIRDKCFGMHSLVLFKPHVRGN